MRNWQEQGFRDLNSGGWQLEMCRLRSAERMSSIPDDPGASARLQPWQLGNRRSSIGKARRLIKTKDGKLRRPLSFLKEGLVYLIQAHLRQIEFPSLIFIRDQRLC